MGDTFIFKIVVIGESKSGKTSIVQKITQEDVPLHYCETIGVEFSSCRFELSDKNIAKIQFWDIAGNPRFGDLVKNYIYGSSGIILMIDSSDPNALKKSHKWMKYVKENNRFFGPVFLLIKRSLLLDLYFLQKSVVLLSCQTIAL